MSKNPWRYYGRFGSCFIVDELTPHGCLNKARVPFHKKLLVCQKHYARLLRASGDGGNWARAQ